ncbi:MAG: M20/M25/M40 family metallo-hydrolase, partial [Deltaproteobacteria bacterium]
MTAARRKRALEQAMRHLEDQRTAIEKTLEALVEVSSWTGDKSGVDAAGAVYAHAMPLQCLRVLSESYGDHLVFHGPRRGSDDGVMLIGHMDTVFPRKTFRGYRSEGDIAFGPGVLDMKGGLVVMAFALRAIESIGALEHVPVTAIV